MEGQPGQVRLEAPGAPPQTSHTFCLGNSLFIHGLSPIPGCCSKRRGADVVIEVSGGTTAFSEGIDLVRRGGRFLVIGQVGEQQVSIAPRLVVEKQLTILGVMSGDTDHYYKALQFLRHNREHFRFEDMLSNYYRLEQINDAMESMRALREVKPVVVMP